MGENLKTMALRIFKANHWFNKEKFTFLLISLVFYSIAAPFFRDFFHPNFFINFFFLILLLAAVFAVSSEAKHLILILILSGLRIGLYCYTLFAVRLPTVQQISWRSSETQRELYWG